MINFRNPYCYFCKLTYRQIFPAVYCFSQPCLELLFAIEAGYFFDYLLEKAHIVGTPGSGFGAHGEGYFRLTAFGSYENTLEAIERIKNL